MKKWWQQEDSWAILLGAALLLGGLLFYSLVLPADWAQQHARHRANLQKIANLPLQGMDYWNTHDQQAALQLTRQPAVQPLQRAVATPLTWQYNPLRSILPAPPTAAAVERAAATQQVADSLKQLAFLRDNMAEVNAYTVPEQNRDAEIAIADWRAARTTAQAAAKKAVPADFSLGLCFLFALGLLLLFSIAAHFLAWPLPTFAAGFAFVFLLALLSYILGAHTVSKTYGISYAAWALLLGLLISNTVGVPAWAKPALRTPFYIKTGLVLLGAEVLFNKVMAIGLPGLFVAWIVTPIVLLTTYWFGQKVLRISSKTLNITISADMSVCGVSAAVATAAACGAKKEELTLAIGLSMLFTSIMMIVMPLVIHALGMPEVLGGAWIGGTLDATGAVVAAGSFLGETALNVAATIKMIQNILIGVIAFGVAVYFSRDTGAATTPRLGSGLSEVWRRFPKFILGFIGASLFFSALYSWLGDDLAYSLLDHGVIRGFTKDVRGWLFALAFVSIGLSTRFSELQPYLRGGKPLLLYVTGQAFNLLLTLLMAYIMFYLVFPDITAN